MVKKKSMSVQEVRIQLGSAELGAFLHIPDEPRGIVLFAHGSGSGRHSPRNQQVARFLQDENFATLLMDLLSMAEEKIDQESRELRFNIPFLAERLQGATDWVNKHPELRSLPIGYFGASTGAAAALVAAADRPKDVKAVVSRGGRPDLAGSALPKVQAATLLIVGGNDFGVIELNQQAFSLLHCEKKLEIVPNATHLFEEPGTLEEVGRLAAHWFDSHP